MSASNKVSVNEVALRTVIDALISGQSYRVAELMATRGMPRGADQPLNAIDQLYNDWRARLEELRTPIADQPEIVAGSRKTTVEHVLIERINMLEEENKTLRIAGEVAMGATRALDKRNEEIADLKRKVEVDDQRSTASMVKLRQLLGYVENGTETAVKIFIDDATRTFHIYMGITGKSGNSYYGNSLEEVIEKANTGENAGEFN